MCSIVYVRCNHQDHNHGTMTSLYILLCVGDDAYPDDLDVTIDVKDMPTIDSTYEELEALPAKFRFRWSKDPKEIFFSLSATAKLRFGQISPVSPKSFNSSAKL